MRAAPATASSCSSTKGKRSRSPTYGSSRRNAWIRTSIDWPSSRVCAPARAEIPLFGERARQVVGEKLVTAEVARYDIWGLRLIV